MNINRNNYEEFFIDYLDGRLNEATIIELEDFLLLNPDLKEELEGMEKVVLKPEENHFTNKELLKQINLEYPIDQENFDFFLIAENEEDLNAEELTALKAFIKTHPEIKADRKRYSSLRLKANEHIIFKNKSQLKKSVFLIYKREIITISSIAAGILLLLGSYYTFLNSGIQESMIQTASNEELVVDSTKISTPVNINKEVPSQKETPKIIELTKIQPTPKITIKVEIPIASLNDNEPQHKPSAHKEEDPEVIAKKLADNININGSLLASFDEGETINQDLIRTYKSSVNKYKGINLADPSKYMSIDQFAKQKLSEVVFGKENKNESLTAFNLVSAGINKINKISGSDMKLQKSIDDQGNELATKFDSKVLSVTRPVKK